MSDTEYQWPDAEMADINDQIALTFARVRMAEMVISFAMDELRKIERRPHAAAAAAAAAAGSGRAHAARGRARKRRRARRAAEA